jgi:catechol 2,3-dioxygenase-like lactoylglutathione lyase family enzyme
MGPEEAFAMPVVKVTDLAFARLQSPDLDLAEKFLTDFGLVRVARTPKALYMRGTGPTHHLHVTHLGAPRFVGLAFHLESEEDLRRLAKAPGADGVEHVDEPGGGQRVRVSDPHGYQMEVVWGLQAHDELPTRRVTRPAGEVLRIPPGPSQVKRLGHAVLMTPGAKQKINWYREMFGLVPSDEVYAGAKDNIIASFNRCDRGERHVDHHSLLYVENTKVGLNHLAFEVQNFDDLMLGHQHLKQAGSYRHAWGIGRHVVGSQVFDYWQDPWGRMHEHWWDTDLLGSRHPASLIPAEEGLASQWGEPIPESFLNHATP